MGVETFFKQRLIGRDTAGALRTSRGPPDNYDRNEDVEDSWEKVNGVDQDDDGLAPERTALRMALDSPPSGEIAHVYNVLTSQADDDFDEAFPPYVVYQVTEESPVETMGRTRRRGDTPTLIDATACVFVHVNEDEGPAKAGEIADKIRDLLERRGTKEEQRGTVFVTGEPVVIVQDVFYLGYSVAFDADQRSYVRTLDFRVWYED